MATTQKRTVILPAEQADYIDKLVESGSYATESEVVSAGIEALQDREADIEDWLRKEVVPVYDAMRADPSRGLSPDEVAAALLAHHEQRVRERSK